MQDGASDAGRRTASPSYDLVDEAVRHASVVLLGEATHGSREFYRERARITANLLREQGVGAVVVEADATDMQRANLYVRGIGPDRSAEEALSDILRFPRWMWRNSEFAEFVEALRTANLNRPESRRAGLYGMDVYDLFGAIDRVSKSVLAQVPAAAPELESLIKCFAPCRRSLEAYGRRSQKPARSCEEQAAMLLQKLMESPTSAQPGESERRFEIKFLAAAIVAGEAYARAIHAGSDSWNVREHGMATAIRNVAAHIGAGRADEARLVVWAHNVHLSNFGSIQMAGLHDLPLADLLRRDGADRVFSVGFLTHAGSFMAAPAWGRSGQVYRLAPASRNSVESLLRRESVEGRLVSLCQDLPKRFDEWRPQRTIGAVFEAAQAGATYTEARLGSQFDAVIFLEHTTAVTPIGR